MKTDIKVGIFALLVLAVLTYMTFKVGGWGFLRKPGYSVYVNFKNVTGIDRKSRIRVAGVDVGYIEDIGLSDGVAEVKLRIKPEVKLCSDASATIRTVGLLGERYLEIRVGQEPPLLKDGDRIRHVVETVDVDDLIRNLAAVSEDISRFMESVGQVLSKEQIQEFRESLAAFRDLAQTASVAVRANDTKLRKTLDDIDDFIVRLDTVVTENKDDVNELVANLKEFSDTLKRESPGLMSDMRSASSEIKGLVADTRPAIESVVQRTDRLTAEIEEGKGSLGKLLKDERLYNNLSQAAESVEETLGAITRFRTFLNFQAQYLSEVGEAKGQFFVTLQPRFDKYYIIGVTQDPIARVEEKEVIEGGTLIRTEEIKKEVEFTAQFARRLKNTVLRIGLTENTFGAGIDQYMDKDRMRIFVDAWDFSNDEEDSQNPHVTAGMDYFLFKYFYLSAGMDNLLNKRWRGPFIGGGIRFEDEDFKYLLGTAPRVR